MHTDSLLSAALAELGTWPSIAGWQPSMTGDLAASIGRRLKQSLGSPEDACAAIHRLLHGSPALRTWHRPGYAMQVKHWSTNLAGALHRQPQQAHSQLG